MPRKKAAKRKDGRFVATAVIDGKRKFFYSTISQSDAEQKKNEFLYAKHEDELRPVKFKDFAEKWLDYKEKTVKGNTFESTYARTMRVHILPAFGDFLITSIKPIDIRNFLSDKEQKYSKSYVQKMEICLSSLFDAALENDLINKSPCANITVKGGSDQSEKCSYTKEEAEAVIAYAKTDPHGIYIRIMLELGLRASELCGLRWEDFDFEEKTVTINRAVTDYKGMTVVGEPKSKTSKRTLPLSTDLCNDLQSICGKGYVLKADGKGDAPTNPKNYTHRKFNTFMRHMNEQTGIRILNAHEMRHTCGTLLYARSGDIYAVSKYLGHSTVDITAKMYVHNSVTLMRERLKIE